MRIKIGYNWYDALPGQPIMIIFSEEDLELIKGMTPEQNALVRFATEDPVYPTDEDRLKWAYPPSEPIMWSNVENQELTEQK